MTLQILIIQNIFLMIVFYILYLIEKKKKMSNRYIEKDTAILIFAIKKKLNRHFIKNNEL